MANATGKSPTFSVIMPLYNHAGYLVAAAESVLAQTCGDWELCIVDDGSTDGSGRLADELAARDERISAIHQANAGPAAARNAALARTSAPWLTYIDSDDVWLPDALASYGEFIAASPEAQFIYGYRHRLNADGTVTELPGELQRRPTGPAELFARMYLSHLCVCYRRELIDLAGGYDERLGTCEDYELYLRLSLLTPLCPLGRPTGLRRRHAANISRQTGHSRLLQAMILQRFIDRQGGAAVVPPDVVRRRLGKLYYAAGRQYFKSRCFAQARRAIAQAHQHRRTVRSTAVGALSRLLAPLGRTDDTPLPNLD